MRLPERIGDFAATTGTLKRYRLFSDIIKDVAEYSAEQARMGKHLKDIFDYLGVKYGLKFNNFPEK